MSTAITAEQELWSILRSFSEVRDRGYHHLTVQGVRRSDLPSTWKRFGSFIRQALNYWRSAKQLPYESSSLLYYYAFLNLAKARLVIVDPTIQHKMRHGLSYDTNTRSRDLAKQELAVLPGQQNVFPIYYQQLIGTNPPRRLNVQKLLAYAEDISSQYIEGGFGQPRSFPLIQRLGIDPVNGSAWNIVAIPKHARIHRFRKAYHVFFDSFEKADPVDFVGLDHKTIFDFESLEWLHYDFFQLKAERRYRADSSGNYSGDMRERLVHALGPWLSPYYYHNKFDAVLNLPLSSRSPTPVFLTDEIAVYCVMFYMSELVRYRPDLLEDLLRRRPSWLLESFVECCPLKMLRAMVHRIVGPIFTFASY